METSVSGSAASDGATKRQQARTIATFALAALVVAFALLNFREVRVNFIVTTARAPLIVVIVACLAVGLVLGLLAGRKRS